jgi:hypothetical protein
MYKILAHVIHTNVALPYTGGGDLSVARCRGEQVTLGPRGYGCESRFWTAVGWGDRGLFQL